MYICLESCLECWCTVIHNGTLPTCIIHILCVVSYNVCFSSPTFCLSLFLSFSSVVLPGQDDEGEEPPPPEPFEYIEPETDDEN